MKQTGEPYPMWRQRLLKAQASWRRSRDRRRQVVKTFGRLGRRGLTLANSMLGGILVAYGVGVIYRPAGFIVAGSLVWILQWTHGDREGGSA